METIIHETNTHKAILKNGNDKIQIIEKGFINAMKMRFLDLCLFSVPIECIDDIPEILKDLD